MGITLLVLVGSVVELWNFVVESRTASVLDQMFDLDLESNIPTWASSSILLIAAMQLFSLAKTGSEHVLRFRGRWILLGVLFVFLSIDEAARIHERLGDLMLGAADEGTHPLMRNKWVLLYGIALIPIGVSYIRFLAVMPIRASRWFVVAGLVYVGGALGLELFESLAQGSGERSASVTMFLLTTAQETAEMFGVVILIYAVQSYRQSAEIATLRVARPPRPRASDGSKPHAA